MINKDIPPPPLRPKCRKFREGTVGTCPKCHSTEVRRFKFLNLGKKIGCIHPDCDNYYKIK